MQEESHKRILVCPLPWGLGHAGRMIAVIERLRHRHTVIIASDGPAINLLRREFPGLTFIRFPFPTIRYGREGIGTLRWGLLSLYFLISKTRDLEKIKRLVKLHKIDIVLSDNRYGARARGTRNILVSHQLAPKLPRGLGFARPLVHGVIRNLAGKFDQCWVPDYPDNPNLSGKLSHLARPPKNIRFAGPLSRLDRKTGEDAASISVDDTDSSSGREPEKATTSPVILTLLSGPEPQRSIFEEILAAQLIKTDVPALIVQALPCKGRHVKKGKLTMVPHLPDKPMTDAIRSARYVIARAGYSTILDLAFLNKTALLVPTPGQPEQEYLARHLEKQGSFIRMTQKEFDLEKGIQMLKEFRGAPAFPKEDLLTPLIRSLHDNISS